MLGKLCTMCLGKYVRALAATRGLMCGVDLFEGKTGYYLILRSSLLDVWSGQHFGLLTGADQCARS